jgi:iduronate 2-sulfatase
MRSIFATVLLFICPLLAPAAEHLNVLLVIADDFRDFGGAYSHEKVKTPNLDRLRARGTSFERAYVQYPVCNPSRASLLTGLRAEQTGITDNETPLREKMADVVTMPQLFKEAGWQAHAFGKIYHLGGGRDAAKQAQWMDVGRSWHTAQAFEASPIGKKFAASRNVGGATLKWCMWGAAEGGDDDQPDGQIAEASIAMMEKQGDKPWFIGCGFMKPHDPFIAPKKYFDLYPPEAIQPWVDPADMTPAGKTAVGFGEYGKVFATFTKQDWAELLRAYCACTSYMDAQLGRVLDALDKRELWEKTIVIFMGDHGYHTGERRWWNKNTLFERSCRAPLIIAAPGLKRGQKSQSLVEKIPHQASGMSLRPVLEKPTATLHEAAYTLVTRGGELYGQSVRTGRWRFTAWSDGQKELYDQTADPEEAYNIAEQQPEIVQQLSAKIQGLPRPPSRTTAIR